jgi:hypothetical protein
MCSFLQPCLFTALFLFDRRQGEKQIPIEKEVGREGTEGHPFAKTYTALCTGPRRVFPAVSAFRCRSETSVPVAVPDPTFELTTTETVIDPLVRILKYCVPYETPARTPSLSRTRAPIAQVTPNRSLRNRRPDPSFVELIYICS